MRFSFVALSMLFASTASAQTCEYKAVMTDAETEACRHPKPSSNPVTHQPATATNRVFAPSAYPAPIGPAPAPNYLPHLPHVGMTKDEAEEMSTYNTDHTTLKWECYGDRNVTTTARGTREQWVCDPSSSARTYLYIENGVVTSFQDTK